MNSRVSMATVPPRTRVPVSLATGVPPAMSTTATRPVSPETATVRDPTFALVSPAGPAWTVASVRL